MTAIETVRERIPDHARDLRLNLGAIASSTALTPAQAWTIALACAAITRDRTLATAIDATELVPNPGTGSTRWNWQVPNDPTLAGAPFTVQAIVVDMRLPRLMSIVLSNALSGVVG